MQRTGHDFDQADDVAAALSLVRTFGDHARSVAQEQAAKSVGHPSAGTRWSAIADAVGVLQQANVHLEIALRLLNSMTETSAAPLVDQAIMALGLRADDGDVPPTLADPQQREDFYRQKAEQHLAQAKATAGGSEQALHLDLASCYTTLLNRSEVAISS